MVMFHFEFTRPWHTDAGRLQRFAVLTPLVGICRTDPEICAGVVKLQARWRARAHAWRDAHMRLNSPEQFDFWLNCRPAFGVVAPRTHACKNYYCPFCYARRVAIHYVSWRNGWRAMQAQGECTAMSANEFHHVPVKDQDWTSAVERAREFLVRWAAQVQNLSRRRPELGLHIATHVWPNPEGDELIVNNRLFAIGSTAVVMHRLPTYRHEEHVRLRRPGHVVEAGAKFARYPKDWLTAPPADMADVETARQVGHPGVRWWRTYGMFRGRRPVRANRDAGGVHAEEAAPIVTEDWIPEDIDRGDVD